MGLIWPLMVLGGEIDRAIKMYILKAKTYQSEKSEISKGKGTDCELYN